MYGNLKLRLHHGNVTWLSVGGQWRLTSCSITTKEEELRLSAGPRRRGNTCITSVFNFCHILFLSPASSHTLCVCVCLHVCATLWTYLHSWRHRSPVTWIGLWSGLSHMTYRPVSNHWLWGKRARSHKCETCTVLWLKTLAAQMTPTWLRRLTNSSPGGNDTVKTENCKRSAMTFKVPRRGITWRRTLWSAQ